MFDVALKEESLCLHLQINSAKRDVKTATKILRDNETGVLYLVHESGYGAGITALLDDEGKPLIDEAFSK